MRTDDPQAVTYTWTDVARDLALTTRFTISEASAITYPLRDLLPAHASVEPLTRLLRPTRSGISSTELVDRRGAAIAELLELATQQAIEQRKLVCRTCNGYGLVNDGPTSRRKPCPDCSA